MHERRKEKPQNAFHNLFALNLLEVKRNIIMNNNNHNNNNNEFGKFAYSSKDKFKAATLNVTGVPSLA